MDRREYLTARRSWTRASPASIVTWTSWQSIVAKNGASQTGTSVCAHSAGVETTKRSCCCAMIPAARRGTSA
eukprot:3974086-Alexandrium_andersonii.AAC.1